MGSLLVLGFLVSIPICSAAQSLVVYNPTTGVYVNTQNIWPSGFAGGALAGQDWSAAIATGHLIGNNQGATLAPDYVASQQILHYDPGSTVLTRYSTFQNPAAPGTTTVPLAATWVDGVHGGEAIHSTITVGNYGTHTILYDSADGSLSDYSNSSTLALSADYEWTSFADGPLAGQTLASQLGNVFGTDLSVLQLLQSDGSYVRYDYATGALSSDPTWTTLTGGPLDGMSLEAALTGGQFLGSGGVTGLAFVVPEPSVALLGALGLLGLTRRRR